jgi:hypothetical protein
MARGALSHPDLLPADVALASIDHYDVDGLVALGLLVLDGLDAAHGPLLVEAARVGDFEVVTDASAARIAFALNALDERHRVDAPAVTGSSPADPWERCATVADRALGLLFALAAEPERFESWWRPEWSAYDASLRVLAEGGATVEERPELDLAVVRVDPDLDGTGAAGWKSSPLHRAALHSATPCLRVATLAPGRMTFHYRYESWVRLTGRRPRPRVDLERVAHDLTAAETAPSRWIFDGAGSVSGALHLSGDDAVSTIEPEHFVDVLSHQLAILDQGPSAWDPYS